MDGSGKSMSPEENKEIMTTMIQEMFPVKNIATPYMYHHIVEALFEGGLERKLCSDERLLGKDD